MEAASIVSSDIGSGNISLVKLGPIKLCALCTMSGVGSSLSDCMYCFGVGKLYYILSVSLVNFHMLFYKKKNTIVILV